MADKPVEKTKEPERNAADSTPSEPTERPSRPAWMDEKGGTHKPVVADDGGTKK